MKTNVPPLPMTPPGFPVSGKVNFPVPPEDVFQACLATQRVNWNDIMARGLDKCCPQGRKPYIDRPFISMPDSGRRFNWVGSVLVGTNPPAVGQVTIPVTWQDGQTTQRVPIGYDGVIDTVICGVKPGASGSTGFVEGSGTLTWRIAADSIADVRFLRDLGNIKFSIGDLNVPIPTPNSSRRLYSGNLVQGYVVFDSSGNGVLAPDAAVIIGLSGWVYSR